MLHNVDFRKGNFLLAQEARLMVKLLAAMEFSLTNK